VPRLPIAHPLLDIAGDIDPVNLVNPFWFGGGTDPDADDYFDRITAAGATIDATARAAINAFIVGCKADSIWTLLLDVGPLCGDSLTAALIKLKKLSSGWSYTNNNFLSEDYGQSTGLTGDGSSKYLTSGVLGTDLTTDSTGIGVYDRSTTAAQTNPHGSTSGPSACFRLWIGGADNIIYSDQYNTANELASSTISGAIGFVFATRPASSAHAIYRNGSVIASTSTTGGSLPAVGITFFAQNFNGIIADYSNHALSFLCLTAGMDATQSAALNTRVQTLQTALGRNV
jgi:hypothetical protein